MTDDPRERDQPPEHSRAPGDEVDEGESGHREGNDTEASPGPAGSRWEWVAAAVSFVLVAAALGFLIHDAASGPHPPPTIELTVDSVIRVGSGYLVELHARNSSGTTAAGLTIEGSLRTAAEGEPERSQVTLDYLPGHSNRPLGLYFTRDPRGGELEIRPSGYTSP